MAEPQTTAYQTEGIEFPIHPEVTVQLTGSDGNAYAVMGAVRQAMRRACLPRRNDQRISRRSQGFGLRSSFPNRDADSHGKIIPSSDGIILHGPFRVAGGYHDQGFPKPLDMLTGSISAPIGPIWTATCVA